jgi:hypothetical protein
MSRLFLIAAAGVLTATLSAPAEAQFCHSNFYQYDAPGYDRYVPIHACGKLFHYDPETRFILHNGVKMFRLNEAGELIRVDAAGQPAPAGAAVPAGAAPTADGAVAPAPGGAPAAGGVPAAGGSAPAGAPESAPAPGGPAPGAAPAPNGAPAPAGAPAPNGAPAAGAAPANTAGPAPRASGPAGQAAAPARAAQAAAAVPAIAAADLAKGAVNAVEQPTDVAALMGVWRATSKDALGRQTVVELNLEADGNATVLFQTQGQEPTEFKRTFKFENQELTLVEGESRQVLGQLASFDKDRMELKRADGTLTFTRPL